MTLYSGGPSLFSIGAAATIVTIGIAFLVPAIVRYALNHDLPRISVIGQSSLNPSRPLA